MKGADVLRKADEAEAAEYLYAAQSISELTSLWWRFADHHTGATRERLQDIFAKKLASLGALQP